MDTIVIRDLINGVIKGQIRIPAFQRGFVWDAAMVAYLMDSIYRDYPIGSLLLWRTREQLKFERNLGPFTLPKVDPDYPIDYVLDGQQRITSIFGVFQTELPEDPTSDWNKIFFDFEANPGIQESQFAALSDQEADPNRYFPLKALFDTVAYRRATSQFNDQIAKRIDDLQAVFKEARIPVQLVPTEDRKTVAIVFARVNTRKVDLDAMQLLSAWTWSEDFDLQSKFRELSEELEPFGFKEVGSDQDLLLRCCSAVLLGSASTSALVDFDGATVREKFTEIRNGILGAIDFLRDNFYIYSLRNLPSEFLLIPLCVFFASPGNTQVRYTDAQRRTLTRWFWRNCFTNRYRSQPIKTVEFDIDQILKLKRRDSSTKLGDFSSSIDSEYFIRTNFRIDSVATITFVLLLAQKQPRSFITGSPITLREVLKDYNRNEFHHLYAKALLRSTQYDANKNCLANFCFMSKADNNHISNDLPSIYKSHLPADPNQLAEILEHAICPPSLFDDDFEVFINERAALLADEAKRLMDI